MLHIYDMGQDGLYFPSENFSRPEKSDGFGRV
jgi:hypothetical protein